MPAHRFAQARPWIRAACSSRCSLPEAAAASMPRGARGACCDTARAALSVGGALPTLGACLARSLLRSSTTSEESADGRAHLRHCELVAAKLRKLLLADRGVHLLQRLLVLGRGVHTMLRAGPHGPVEWKRSMTYSTCGYANRRANGDFLAEGSILSQVTRVVVYHSVDLRLCFQQVSQEDISLAQAFRPDECCQEHHKAIRGGSKEPSSRASGTAPCRLQLLVCDTRYVCQVFLRRRHASLVAGRHASLVAGACTLPPRLRECSSGNTPRTASDTFGPLRNAGPPCAPRMA